MILKTFPRSLQQDESVSNVVVALNISLEYHNYLNWPFYFNPLKL